jgi:hypothetical protein
LNTPATQDSGNSPIPADEIDQDDLLDPYDTNSIRDRIRGQTVKQADPPRLEDEGQSGG